MLYVAKWLFSRKNMGTVIVKTFARQIFTNFANFGLFRKSLFRGYFSTFPFAKVTPVKVFWFFRPFSYQLKFLKRHFLVQSHYSFCIFPCILNVIPKNKFRYFRLRYLNTVLEIRDVVKHELRVMSYELWVTSYELKA